MDMNCLTIGSRLKTGLLKMAEKRRITIRLKMLPGPHFIRLSITEFPGFLISPLEITQ
jgi:hypothetical protein